MARGRPERQHRPVTPKQVFERCNMPSRWERLTGVSPKVAEDRMFLAFVAARFSGEERLPHPGSLVGPPELVQKRRADTIGAWTATAAGLLGVIGLAGQQPVLTGIAALTLVGALAWVVLVSLATAEPIAAFMAFRRRCEAAQARLDADPLDPDYRSTLDRMISCDEGTLAYCAAKVASEIRRESGADPAELELLTIDLWDELDAVATSAREIAEDREMTDRLRQGRLRDTPEVKQTVAADTRLRETAISLLAERVSAFADYRDQVHLLGSAAWRDRRIPDRALRISSDEMAARALRRPPH